MEKQQARRIIRETFETCFVKSRFISFIKNLFNTIDEERFTYRGNDIPDAYKQYIKLLERIGKFSDDENSIDILIVTLLKDTSLEHARTMQRNFIAWYLNGSRGGAMKDAALVAFVSPNETDWRFSLVKMDYSFEQTKAGNVKVKEKFTPARRWSFLVGANEKSHTAQSRLVDILANDEQAPTLLEIEEAFNIETVTKEFFSKYRELFLRAKEELDKIIRKYPKVKAEFETKGVDTVSFAKKLLGQIVFLYFLQKKGWFGIERDAKWGEGSKHFLRELFEEKYGEYNNFFNDILEPLFYEALRREHSGDYYSHFDCRIPFLNGGLFDPINDYDWWKTDIFLPNDIFSNNNRTKEGDPGDGIFDIFDRYNFTVKEDEPLEKEVAIDPEMLGKVFENLLEVKDRKSKGTYYTPREIVHYMCQESLANYLSTELTGKVSKKDIDKLIKYGESVVENDSHVVNEGHDTGRYNFMLSQSVCKHANLVDEKLASIRICDPAVGSGAFLVGMMNEIIRTRKVLTPYNGDNGKRTPYYFKRQAIQNCLYGVDIDPGAVEITKLRLWLSLIVDEEERETIQPLPNLDYKIMQGNSLLSEFMGVDFDRADVDKNGQLSIAEDTVDNLVEKLEDKKNKYLNKAGVSEKQKLKHEIEALIIEIFETKLQKQKTNYFSKIKVIEEKYNNLPNKEQREMIIRKEKEKLCETSGFNLEQCERQLREYTTGNKVRPFFPWHLYFAEVFHEKKGFDIVIGNPPYIQLQKNRGKLAKIYSKSGFEVFKSMGDIYCLFYERGIQLLKDNGVLCYITSNKWMRAGYGESLRGYFIKYDPLVLIDLGPGVFEAATVDTSILIIKKVKDGNDKRQKNLSALSISNIKDNNNNINIANLLKEDGVILSTLTNNAWFIGNDAEQKLKEKIEKIGKPLKEWDVKIYRGVLTGLNKAFIIDTPTKERICKKDPKSIEILKPILRGRDIKRYGYDWDGLWLISTFPALKIGIDDYHAVKEYLLKFGRERLEQVGKVLKDGTRTRKKTNNKWHETQDTIGYYDEFEKEKILYSEIVKKPQFCFDTDKRFYCEATAFLMTGNNLKTLIGVMNSKLFTYIFKKWYTGGGLGSTGVRYKKQFLELVPVPPLNTSNCYIKDQLENLVNQTLLKKKEDFSADTSLLESEIDKLVYELYEFTDEEIKIIEGV